MIGESPGIPSQPRRGLAPPGSLRSRIAVGRLVTRPEIALPVSFLLLVVAGAMLIKLPPCLPAGHTLGWLDALFTMTSAVCLTGLVVHDTATHFTPAGQAVIAVFIQLGGLGMITLGSMIALRLGGAPAGDMRRFRRWLAWIVLGVLAIELIGAALLFPLWDDPAEGPMSLQRRAGLSLFHAVGAFCNSGFALVGDSLTPYRYTLLPHAVIAPLIVIGGLGAPVLADVAGVVRHRLHGRSRPRLSLHTRLVLVTSAGLYLLGVIAFAGSQAMPWFYESLGQGQTAHVDRPGALALHDAGRLLADASFMSIAARTAGLHTVPMDEVRPAGTFTLVLLMLTGGSPGSTAGGVTTTVAAVLLLSVVATLRQHRRTRASGRAIWGEIVRRAGALCFGYAALVVVATLALCLSEPFPLEKLLFEVVSAATNTGLSLGVTADLSGFGKTVIIVTMFLGRVGPLALLGALVFRDGPRAPGPRHVVAIG